MARSTVEQIHRKNARKLFREEHWFTVAFASTIVLWIALWGAVIFVAVHFLLKVW